MRPKYIAGPINSRLNPRFIPHMGKRVPFGIVSTASTYLIKKKKSKKRPTLGRAWIKNDLVDKHKTVFHMDFVTMQVNTIVSV